MKILNSCNLKKNLNNIKNFKIGNINNLLYLKILYLILNIYKILFTISLATIQTVLTENFLLHKSNISSNDGPNKSIHKILSGPSCPK